MIRLPQFSGIVKVNLMGQNANGNPNIGRVRQNTSAMLENARRGSGGDVMYEATSTHGHFDYGNNLAGKALILSQLQQIGVKATDIDVQA
jgi:hypothetical protein